MTGREDTILLYGFGNTGRGDDGLGPALASAIEAAGLAHVDVAVNQQLCVEDAVQIAGYATVVFADAATQGPAPFHFSVVDASAVGRLGWTSHSMYPVEVVALARDLFGRRGPAYTLAIRGYRFAELEEVLSAAAKENLAAAVAFVKNALVERQFEGYVAELGTSAADSGGATWKA